jgi:hypothetical protein
MFQQTRNFVSKGKKRLQKEKITRGATFFLSDRIFLPYWPEKSVMSWQLGTHL